MSPNTQFILSFSIPSVLVILSWINNNTRLSRLEAGLDNTSKRLDETNRRMDELVRGVHGDMMSFQASMHGDMMGFQASLLEAVFQIRERVSVLESKQSN
jgi:queuine/archaeosine tRNA-ribosyltransferase